MEEISWSFERKLNKAVRKSFRIVRLSGNAILFKNQVVDYDHFTLYCEWLSEDEVLEVAKILGKLYEDFSTKWNVSASERDLNSNCEESSRIVKAIVSLDSSPLHKFLLLTSSDEFFALEDRKLGSKESSDTADQLAALAKVKKEFCSDASMLTSARNLFADLKKLYILPGVSARSVMPQATSLDIAASHRLPVETVAKITAFAAEKSEDITLYEFLKLDFAEAIKTQKSILDFGGVNTLMILTRSELFSDLILSMTALEARAVEIMVPKFNVISEIALPQSVIKNRAAAMVHRQSRLTMAGKESFMRYLSPDEARAISSATFAETVNNHLLGNPRARTLPIIYAAIAEVYAVKGEAKTLEVVKEMKHLRLLKNVDARISAATAFLITEALNPENDEMPFSWAAQMSEYGWVLTSHIPSEEEAILENMIV